MPDTLPTSKAVKSAKTKEALLLACMRLFARHGFANTSVDEIARAAKVTKGAVYWHFEDKDALFGAILEMIREQWQRAVLDPVLSAKGAEAQLEQLFVSYASLFEQEPDICYFIQRVLLDNDGTYSAQVASVMMQTAGFVGKLIRKGQQANEIARDLEPRLVAHLVLGCITGATQQHIVNPGIGVDHLLSEAKRIVITSIRKS